MAKEILNQHVDDTTKHIPSGGTTGQVLSKGVSGYVFVDQTVATPERVITGATLYSYNNIGGAF